MVSVDELPAVTELGLNDAVAPAGRPLAVSVTVSAEPLRTLVFTVNGAGCAAATNPNDVPIQDNSTAESPVTVSGCSGNGSATSSVAVNIVHTYIGDLIVDLVAPDGTAYNLHNRGGGSTDNISQTYTVNLSSEPRNGPWKLRVQDRANADTGYINNWTLTT